MAAAEFNFPLPLTDFEDYAFRDDTAEHPMVIVLRTPFEGKLDEIAFRRALQESLTENPLLRSVVDTSGWKSKWQLLEDSSPMISCTHCTDDHPPLNCPPLRIDLKNQPGAAFDLRLCATRGVLVSYFHHACSDGIGAIRFLGDVFARYGQQTATSDDLKPIVRTLDPEVLKLRGTTRMPGQTVGRRAPLLHTLMETGRLLFRHSHRWVGRTRPAETVEAVENIVHSEVIPRSIVKHLRAFASRKRVTTNDVCLLAVLQQMDSWSARDTSASDRDLFRILMPVSMRNPEHDQMSAANAVSYVFHSYRRHELRDPDALLAKIHRKSHEMVTRNEGAAMLHGFRLTRWIPGLFSLSKKLQPGFATAVMTNVGEVRRLFENRFPLKQGRAIAGDVTIQSIDGVAPVRDNTNITVAFGTYGGDLFMHVNRNPSLFSSQDAKAVVAGVADRLIALIQPAKAPAERPVLANESLSVAATTVDVSAAESVG